MEADKDLQYWIDLWESNGYKDQNQQEFWGNRADFFNEKVFRGEKTGSNIVDLLREKEMLSKEMNVLDIGCGPGKQTLPMAKEVGSITALDISKNMLDYLKENMKTTNTLNITPLNLDWKDVNLKEMKWENKYDLVFASMTPGVFNYETLEKMLIASKKYCYLSSFVKRQDLLGDEIRKYIYKKYQVPFKKHNKIYYVFNILWQLGYTPEVQYLNRNWEDEMSIDEAFDLYKDKIASSVTLTDQDQEKIKDVLRKDSQNGKIIEKTKVTQGIFTWEA